MPNTLEADLPSNFLALLGQADLGAYLVANRAGALLLTEVMIDDLFG